MRPGNYFVSLRESTLKDAVSFLRDYNALLERRGGPGVQAQQERVKLAIAEMNDAMGAKE